MQTLNESTMRRRADRAGYKLHKKGDGYMLTDHQTRGAVLGWDNYDASLQEVQQFLSEEEGRAGAD